MTVLEILQFIIIIPAAYFIVVTVAKFITTAVDWILNKTGITALYSYQDVKVFRHLTDWIPYFGLTFPSTIASLLLFFTGKFITRIFGVGLSIAYHFIVIFSSVFLFMFQLFFSPRINYGF